MGGRGGDHEFVLGMSAGVDIAQAGNGTIRSEKATSPGSSAEGFDEGEARVEKLQAAVGE